MISGLKWHVGDAQVTQVTEAPADDVLMQLMPDSAPETFRQHPRLRPNFIDDATGRLKSWFQSFLVTVNGTNILIEAGVGNGRQRPTFPGLHQLQTDFLQRLAEAGAAPAEIDVVLSTHLHIDHIGWFTQRSGDQWVPTFPNARHIIVQAEYDFWKTFNGTQDQVDAFHECVPSVVAAGLVDFVDTDHQVHPAVRLQPTPGHTIAHVAVVLESQGQRAVFSGDVFPHPGVILEPEMSFGSDFNPEQAVQTRRALLRDLAGTDTLLFSPHFADPVAVRIEAAGDGHTFVLA